MPTLLEIFGVNEAVRPGVLYHGTDPDNCADILRTNRITGHTEHQARPQDGFRPTEINKYGRVYGVSLTRDPNFARRWKSGQGMVLVLDEAKLRQRHRIVPYNYYGNREGIGAEAEEFLIGSLPNLSNYLLAIEASGETANAMADDDELYDPGDGRYSLIMASPLLRVNGKQWDSMSGRIAA